MLRGHSPLRPVLFCSCISVATHQMLCADLDATREVLVVVAAPHREQKDSTELCSLVAAMGPEGMAWRGGAAGG